MFTQYTIYSSNGGENGEINGGAFQLIVSVNGFKPKDNEDDDPDTAPVVFNIKPFNELSGGSRIHISEKEAINLAKSILHAFSLERFDHPELD